jgi:hypothetical protein
MDGWRRDEKEDRNRRRRERKGGGSREGEVEGKESEAAYLSWREVVPEHGRERGAGRGAREEGAGGPRSWGINNV